MAILRNGKNTLKYKTLAEVKAEAKAWAEAKAKAWAEARAEAKAKAEAEAKAEAKAKAKADTLQHLNSRADEILSKQSVGLSTTTKLVEDYRIAGLPVPAFLISTIVNGVKKLPTIHYPEEKPCVCAGNFRYGDEAWFDEHLRSGKCTAYKMYR
jgi:hypothetical protein